MVFDTIVIGAGPGGLECSRVLARAKQKVALIEYRDLGGTCVNRGCIPAKTMLFSAEMFRLGKKIRQYGIRFCEDTPSFDFDGMVKKRNEIIDTLRLDLAELCERDGVQIIKGKAEFVSENQIKVEDQILTAANIVIASGGSARRFAGFKEEDPRYLVSDNIFELKAFPKSIVIVGGGPVGTEFATFFATFGIKVTLVDMSQVLMAYYDNELGLELKKTFESQGIDVFTGTSIESLDDSGDLLKFKLSNGLVVESEMVLSAIGVVPAVDYLKHSGVKITDKGRVETNEHMQTTQPHIYALGDSVGRSGSAYGAEREGVYIAHHILGAGCENYNLDYVHFPDVVFTDPEIATCGYSSEELKAEAREFYVKKALFAHNGKSLIKGDQRGFCKMVVDAKTDVVLGVHILGPQATEIIHTVPMALDRELTVKQWRRYVWGHPVLAEIIKETLEEIN